MALFLNVSNTRWDQELRTRCMEQIFVRADALTSATCAHAVTKRAVLVWILSALNWLASLFGLKLKQIKKIHNNVNRWETEWNWNNNNFERGKHPAVTALVLYFVNRDLLIWTEINFSKLLLTLGSVETQKLILMSCTIWVYNFTSRIKRTCYS